MRSQEIGRRTCATAPRAHAPAAGPRMRGPKEESAHDKSVPHGVLRNRPWLHELEQVVRATGLSARARELVPPKRLASYLGARDPTVDIQVAHRRAAAHVADRRGIARE